jgi:hypothetical protein
MFFNKIPFGHIEESRSGAYFAGLDGRVELPAAVGAFSAVVTREQFVVQAAELAVQLGGGGAVFLKRPEFYVFVFAARSSFFDL